MSRNAMACLYAQSPQKKNMTDLEGYFLVGPTASGKTSVAHYLALAHEMDILSADSMLVYSGMDVGTAKPSAQQRSEVHYAGIDIVDPLTPFDLAAYHRSACEALATLAATGRKTIVVGGSGLYLKSLTHGLSPLAPPDDAVRDKVSRMINELGVAEAVRSLTAAAPSVAKSIVDPSNPRRVMRAFEFAEAGYESIPNSWKNSGPGTPVAGINPDREFLKRRIRARVEAMYDNGLIDEVQELMKNDFEAAPTASRAIGYSEAIDHISGRATIREAKERTIIRTNQLAKRQLTWFKHQMNVKWLEIDETVDLKSVAHSVMEIWRQYGPIAIRTTT
ncbi:MAG: tRNA (adenosine(37)-N6)-dimethylallyltransferase MiaA [Lentisphaerales bacterium]|jgi:tRNA dimethylallyltransferase|nr:MAG: tRNA (adenosine(37)-N6)-dimethylallyltransferase MiaA [Lentisphaerales bacterium]